VFDFPVLVTFGELRGDEVARHGVEQSVEHHKHAAGLVIGIGLILPSPVSANFYSMISGKVNFTPPLLRR
jgi:hypothetical protein